jgi:hypothetical protein
VYINTCFTPDSLADYHGLVESMPALCSDKQKPAQNCFTTKDTKSTKASEDKALDATCKPGDIEVDKKSGLHSRELHVGKLLSLVNAFDCLHTLQLDYKLVLNYQVQTIATVKLYAFVLRLVADAAT